MKNDVKTEKQNVTWADVKPGIVVFVGVIMWSALSEYGKTLPYWHWVAIGTPVTTAGWLLVAYLMGWIKRGGAPIWGWILLYLVFSFAMVAATQWVVRIGWILGAVLLTAVGIMVFRERRKTLDPRGGRSQQDE